MHVPGMTPVNSQTVCAKLSHVWNTKPDLIHWDKGTWYGTQSRSNMTDSGMSEEAPGLCLCTIAFCPKAAHIRIVAFGILKRLITYWDTDCSATKPSPRCGNGFTVHPLSYLLCISAVWQGSAGVNPSLHKQNTPWHVCSPLLDTHIIHSVTHRGKLVSVDLNMHVSFSSFLQLYFLYCTIYRTKMILLALYKGINSLTCIFFHFIKWTVL